ncbi:Hsp20/alpha crystallin family protein [Streptomyces sp. NPDC005438]|uniref:Hsp20/alpha crystallin family protein n=1 Tax=Streptomyces sp. NPDC005438 TaxID=3156880 RepID=UPI0033BC1F98
MLKRTNPLYEWQRLIDRSRGAPPPRSGEPVEAWCDGDTFLVDVDLPGVPREAIGVSVDGDVVTVRAERGPHDEVGPREGGAEARRPARTFSRRVPLGRALDVDRVRASYEGGVLRLRIPLVDRAAPRRTSRSGHGARPGH